MAKGKDGKKNGTGFFDMPPDAQYPSGIYIHQEFPRTHSDRYEYPSGIPRFICDMFEYYALLYYDQGHRRYGARGILHDIRWHHRIEKEDGPPQRFKVGNPHSPHLARWVMRKHPKLRGFFKTRMLGVNLGYD